MNRDEGIYNVSNVYDPVIQDEVNKGWKIYPATQQLDHRNNNSPEEDCSSLRNCRQKREFSTILVEGIKLVYMHESYDQAI